MSKKHYPFTKCVLPYGYRSLVPHCDPDTLYLHHVRVYGNDVDMLNFLLSSYPAYQGWNLEDLICKELALPPIPKKQIRHYAGSVYAHNLFFGMQTNSLAPLSHNKLIERLCEEYGSMCQFQNFFKQAAHHILGVGWVWLVAEKDGSPHIVMTPDNEIPNMDILHAVLVLDVWEHAYFLHYPTQIDTYINNWFQTVNWERAEAAYLSAQQHYDKTIDESGKL